MQHSGTLVFETERLLCRRFTWDDAADMHRNWAADEGVQREYGELVYATPEAVYQLLTRYIDNDQREDAYRWAIIEKASGKPTNSPAG